MSGAGLIVGRARELSALQDAVAQLRASPKPRGRIVLLTGEAGIGKSTLAAEAARFVEADGGAAVFGRAWEAGASPPFWSFTQVLRALDESGAVPDAAELKSGPLGLLLEGRTEGVAPDRFEIFDAFTRLLAACARERPLCVVLDDLHVADRASLVLLGFVAQHVRTMPLLIVGTMREVEVRLSPERSDLIAKIARNADVLPLVRLDKAAVAELVPGGDDVVTAVFAKTEGNPLFVTEVVRLLDREAGAGAVGVVAGGVASIPDGVRAAIRENLAHVSPECRAALEVASVFGREYVVTDAADTATVAQLRAAERAGIVAVMKANARTWRFTHVLTRDVLYDDLEPARRCDLHRQAALALAATTPAPLAEIARHFAEAGAVDEAIAYARRASRAAHDTLAFEEAVAPLEGAVAIAPDAQTRGALLIELAEARIRAGDGEGGWRDCRVAADLARQERSSELLARAALAFGTYYVFAHVNKEMVALLEEATCALPRDTPAHKALHARVMARLAGAMQPAADPRAPLAIAREVIATTQDLGDDDTRIAVLVGAGSALQDIAEPSERRPLNEELLTLVTAKGDQVLMLRARLRLAFDHLAAGDGVGADAQMRAYERIAVAFRQPRHHFSSTMYAAMRALGRGEDDDYERLVTDARALAADDAGAERCLAVHTLYAGLLRGGANGVRANVERVRDLCDAFPSSMAATEALICMERGDAKAAAAALASVSVNEHVIALPTHVRAIVVYPAVAVGTPELRAALYDALLPAAERVLAWGHFAMFLGGPLASELAALADSLGRHEDAERHRATATRIAAAIGFKIRAQHVVDASSTASSSARAPASAPPAQRADVHVSITSEGDAWVVSGAGETGRVKDSVGVRMLKKLVDNVGRELHAAKLAGQGHGGLVEGDIGPALDERAKAAYRARLRELRAEQDEAAEWNDVERQARAADEIERLTQELSRALGLGGRDRKQAASAAERARVNAQRRLTDAIKRVGEACPNLGKHFADTIRTGMFCWYDPSSRKRPA